VTTTKLFGAAVAVATVLASGAALARGIIHVAHCSGPSWLNWGGFCALDTTLYMLCVIAFFGVIQIAWAFIKGAFSE
jgi:hypothetical protein